MKEHRKPRPNVSKSTAPSNTPPATPSNATPSNVSAGDALERLYTELVEVAALAQAAGEAVTQLPSTSSRATRRSFARLYALVNRTASEASAALTLGENLVSALSAHMAAQRVRLEQEHGAR